MKYPKSSVLSLHDGCTDAIVASLLMNLPHAYGSDVLPVPEIPCKITSLVAPRAATNNLIILILIL